MHCYGDEDFSDEMFSQVDAAAWYIGERMANWFRIPVRQMKEKFGTVRVYCGFGFSSVYSIWRPQHMWVPKWWPWSLDLKVSKYVMSLINRMIVPIQISGYRYFYKKAIKKWPYLKAEILCCADYPEYLKEI